LPFRRIDSDHIWDSEITNESLNTIKEYRENAARIISTKNKKSHRKPAEQNKNIKAIKLK